MSRPLTPTSLLKVNSSSSRQWTSEQCLSLSLLDLLLDNSLVTLVPCLVCLVVSLSLSLLDLLLDNSLVTLVPCLVSLVASVIARVAVTERHTLVICTLSIG